MIELISTRLTSFIVKQEVIDEKNEKEIAICHYGIEVFIASVVNMLLILILGIFSNTFFDSIIFLLVFVPIRQCTGGYHAETYFICNLTLVATYLFVIICKLLIPDIFFIKAIIWLFSFFIVFIYAPCDNKHKRISREKKKKFKLICRGIWLMIGAFLIVFSKWLAMIQMNVILTMSVISILIVVDIIFKKKEEKKDG